MKRDFLKQLGIEDKEIIDKILDENSADIGRAKGELENYKTKVLDLENTVNKKENELIALRSKAVDIESLNDRISQLETDKTNLSNQLNTEVSKIQRNHAIENGVRDAKARNIKAVIAQLDMDKITFENGELSGLTEQIDVLKTNEDTSFLFGATTNAPAGTQPNNPPSNGGSNPPMAKSLNEAIVRALKKN